METLEFIQAIKYISPYASVSNLLDFDRFVLIFSCNLCKNYIILKLI